jgi:hypothetical protein
MILPELQIVMMEMDGEYSPFALLPVLDDTSKPAMASTATRQKGQQTDSCNSINCVSLDCCQPSHTDKFAE